MTLHRGKGMKFVGDSRIPAERKPNIPKDYSEYPGKTEAFWPNFLLKEWLVGAVFLIGFLVLTVVHAPPLERMADPTDTGYIPLPDWYFLFLYQLLKIWCCRKLYCSWRDDYAWDCVWCTIARTIS